MNARKKLTREKLVEVFDQQKAKLMVGAKDTLSHLKDRFRSLRARIPESLEVNDVANLSLLLVIPEREMALHRQMSMVKLGGKNGSIKLSVSSLKPATDWGKPTRPRLPYLIFDVDSGLGMQERWFYREAGVKELQHTTTPMGVLGGRIGLTVEQGINFVLHRPALLRRQFLALSGSWYYDRKLKEDLMPHIWTSEGFPGESGGVPELVPGYPALPIDWWGLASHSGFVIA